MKRKEKEDAHALKSRFVDDDRFRLIPRRQIKKMQLAFKDTVTTPPSFSPWHIRIPQNRP